MYCSVYTTHISVCNESHKKNWRIYFNESKNTYRLHIIIRYTDRYPLFIDMLNITYYIGLCKTLE